MSFFVEGQIINNEGRDFWAVFPTHVPASDYLANMSLLLTSKGKSSGKIQIGDTIVNFILIPNQTLEVKVPRKKVYLSDTEAEKVVSGKSVHIIVDDDAEKIVAFAHIYASARSAAYLILPSDALGSKYYSFNAKGDPAPNQTSNGGKWGMSNIVILATQANTDVKIRVKGLVKNIHLPKIGDIYQLLDAEDISGSLIETENACSKIAVFSGHTGVGFAPSNATYDPLVQQLYSVQNWGRNYGIIPFYERAHFFKIIAATDQTEIKQDGLLIATLNAGQTYTSSRQSDPSLIESNKPISVAVYSYSNDNSSKSGRPMDGDPEMVILNPIEFGINQITLFSSNLEAISSKYINVLLKTSDADSFRINGQRPRTKFRNLILDPEYSYLQEPAVDKSLTLSGSGPFNAIAYGFGPYESYAYSAGSGLLSTYFIKAFNKEGEEISKICLGDSATYSFFTPFELSAIEWNLDGTFHIYNPASAKQVVYNDMTYMRYDLPIFKKYINGNKANIQVSAIVSDTDKCAKTAIKSLLDIELLPIPIIDFSADTSVPCSNDLIRLTAISKNNNITWKWTFDDGSSDSQQVVQHRFQGIGPHKVTLQAQNENGCWAPPIVKSIVIQSALPALFEAESQVCTNVTVTVKDKSAEQDATVMRYVNFGDGSPTVSSMTSEVSHKYTQSGNYRVTFYFRNKQGCESAPYSKTITVNQLRIPDFILPKICVNDGIAIFKNITETSSGSNMRYEWDFGDNQSPENVSNDLDGKHRYQRSGIYKVRLMMANPEGCTSYAVKDLVVNGPDPKAKFDLIGNPILCANTPLILQNKSTVIYGSVTKLKWILIQDGKEILSLIDEEPIFEKAYSFDLSLFNNGYLEVQLQVFSGTVCSDLISSIYRIVEMPALSVTTPEMICSNQNPIKIFDYNKQFGLSAEVSGRGLTADGFLDPSRADIGTNVYMLSLRNASGCVKSISTTITINSMPTVNAGDDRKIARRGSIKLNGHVNSDFKLFYWSPSATLSDSSSLTPVASPKEDTEYSLIAVNKYGCEAVDKIWVRLKEVIEIPNVFSPNHDGVNDTWNIKDLEAFPHAEIKLYNRYGELIFISKGYQTPFNGTKNGRDLPIGTYFYMITLGDGQKDLVGSVNLLR